MCREDRSQHNPSKQSRAKKLDCAQGDERKIWKSSGKSSFTSRKKSEDNENPRTGEFRSNPPRVLKTRSDFIAIKRVDFRITSKSFTSIDVPFTSR
jgi:hypothetical protein